MARNRIFLWAMRRYFPKADSFLEIGCATGMVLSEFQRAFPQLRVAGTEIFIEGLDEVPCRVRDAFVFQADARHLPFEREFDVIGAFDVLEHIEEDVSVLEQLYQSVKPGGGIIVSVPQHRFLWSQRDETLCHKRRYTRQELADKTRQAGFEIARMTSFITLPFPAMLIESMMHRKKRTDYNPLKTLKTGGLTNTVLNMILTFERQLIKCGVPFLFGGSLLLIAKRK